MTAKIVVHATKAVFAAMLLTFGWLAPPANAQVGIRGSFTLPFEARWGHAVLPPGDYQFTFDVGSLGTELVIRDAHSLRAVAIEPVNIREDSKEGTSSLLIGARGTQRVVYSLRIAELSEAFIYARPPAAGREAEEARQTQTVRVAVAKN
jgi:hypothetical protein